PGPRRSTRAGCTPWRTPTRPPRRRSAHCWPGCPPMARYRCLCSTAATTPRSSPSTSLDCPPGCWCGCGRTVASTPTRHRAHRVPTAGRAAPAPSSRLPIRPPRRPRPPPPPAPPPTATPPCPDDQYGTVTVHAWSGLHPKQHRHPGHGTRGPRPIVRGTIIRVAVQRVPARTRPPKVLWLWWAGPGEFDLDLAWRAYVRRFDLEHTVRFAKQTLGWTTPRPRTPEQADRWTWLVLA